MLLSMITSSTSGQLNTYLYIYINGHMFGLRGLKYTFEGWHVVSSGWSHFTSNLYNQIFTIPLSVLTLASTKTSAHDNGVHSNVIKQYAKNTHRCPLSSISCTYFFTQPVVFHPSALITHT